MAQPRLVELGSRWQRTVLPVKTRTGCLLGHLNGDRSSHSREVVKHPSDIDAGEHRGIGDGGRDPGGSVEEVLVAKLGLFGDTLDGLDGGVDLGLVGFDGGDVVDAGVGGMHSELSDVVEEVADLGEGAVGGFDEVGGVLSIGDSLIEAGDLRAQVFGDDEPCGVIGSGVDAQTARELLDAASDGIGNLVQVVKGAKRRYIGVE
ncbi:hypothetical protein CTKA_02246, partial [Chthonomonas calidirosea]